jgi:hypothetical protein
MLVQFVVGLVVLLVGCLLLAWVLYRIAEGRW